VRVVVAGRLPRQPHNAPLHLFSASPELVGFGSDTYRQRSKRTSLLLEQLFEREEFAMSYTMEDFVRDYMRRELQKLTPDELKETLEPLPPEKRLAGYPCSRFANT
jgi:hypothetical protein